MIVYDFGDEQLANDPVDAPGPSSLQSKVEPPSVEEKVKLGWLSPVRPDGPESIVVSGVVVTTVQLRVSSLGSVFPA